MSSRNRGPIVGKDFFEKVPRRRLDGDWFGQDSAGRIGFFAGGDAGSIPLDADVERAAEALDALSRASRARGGGGAYRSAGHQANEPIFDVPSSSDGRPLHELPIDGYPHLVVGEDAATLRAAIAARDGAREVLVRRGLGVVFADLHDAEAAELHARGICAGCRALDPLDDPRPRAPAALAGIGLYVFAHTSRFAGDPYVRVASPTLAADLADVEPIVALLAQRVLFPIELEKHSELSPWDHVSCR